jgi:hypothetical protein
MMIMTLTTLVRMSQIMQLDPLLLLLLLLLAARLQYQQVMRCEPALQQQCHLQEQTAQSARHLLAAGLAAAAAAGAAGVARHIEQRQHSSRASRWVGLQQGQQQQQLAAGNVVTQ